MAQDDDIKRRQDEINDKLTELEKVNTDRHIENIQRIKEMETTLKDVYRKLFGNGQPGMEQKITELEKNVAKIMAAVGVFLALIEGGHIALEHFWK